MKSRLSEDAQLLTIIIGESDKWRGRPLYAMILDTLKKGENCRRNSITRCGWFWCAFPYPYRLDPEAIGGPSALHLSR